MHECELSHSGIKGQKWGVRRFQNEDRTLTPAGKERYSKAGTEKRKEKEERKAQKEKAAAERKAEKQARRDAKEAAKPESSKWKSKDAKYLSDEELNRRNNRLQREKQYRDLTEPAWKKNAKKTAFGLIAAATTIPLTAVAGAAVQKLYKGEFNKFIAPWVSQQVGFNMKLKEK